MRGKKVIYCYECGRSYSARNSCCPSCFNTIYTVKPNSQTYGVSTEIPNKNGCVDNKS